MERVQTGGDLHRLDLVHGLAGGIERTAQFERRTAVGVIILHYQILHLLGIHERSREGLLPGHYGLIVLKTVLRKHFLHLLVRTRSDFVNHRPRICHLPAVTQILQETFRNETVLDPSFRICQHAVPELVAVVGTVVGALEGQRQGSRAVTFEHEGCDLAHGQDRAEPPLKVCRSD